eukprot:jgi/Astpho2/1002/fgenesh1_pg.00016_%23_162_t
MYCCVSLYWVLHSLPCLSMLGPVKQAALKILSRKRCNRQQFGQDGIAAVLEHLAATSLTKRAAAEAANVILNVCYEKSNVELVLELGGIQKLVKLLADRDPHVQANAAGAIQSICFQDSGRHGVREAGAVTLLVQLLDSPQSKVQARAVGALHNLSSDSNSIRLIRRGGGIPKLVHLLRSHSWAVCGSAAGALQNVSREVASRMVVRELDTVCPLAELLAAPDLQAQVCAAGALLNILGPELEHSKYGVAQRHGLAALMAQALALAMVSGCLTPVGLRHLEQSLPVG